MRNQIRPFPLAVIVVVAVSASLSVLLLSGGMTPEALITPGGRGPAAPLIRADFGDEAVDPELSGYDGQQVYAIAREFPDLPAAAQWLDSPRYRMLRVVPPAVASVAPPGTATVLALLVLNVAGLGLAVHAGGRLLEHVGRSPHFAAPAGVVLLLGVATTTIEPVAWGLTLVGLSFAVDGRHRPAVLALTIAALTRETTVVAAAAVGGGLWWSGVPLRRVVPYALPSAVVLAWYVALGAIVGGGLPARADAFGFLRIDSPATGGIVVLVAALGALAVHQWRDHPPVAACAAAFTGWLLIYTTDILDPLALLRVNGLPVFLGILAVGRLRRESHCADISHDDREALDRPP